ncbi:LOW QUALITY PROTEIN: rho guanine nucleotide exchange factor 37 [Microcaecilia unicolor]|uniref:LOW QUALITY PROTEIN: rho guanine nucleotide exchange factor 37 n=1 Tax=Microcaecilia unicolor TaxID=1415580 RepID=A0A6P7YWC3_9AMPH|nr:LOW QUALITY PROTEIN: rho guanine nucleotide exchange factor 37 [Microcaecilia unicolor]
MDFFYWEISPVALVYILGSLGKAAMADSNIYDTPSPSSPAKMHDVLPMITISQVDDTPPAEENTSLYETTLEVLGKDLNVVFPPKESQEKESIYEEVGTLSRSDRTQQQAVEELIKTESSYVQTLLLLASDIQDRVKQVKGHRIHHPCIDVEGLFSTSMKFSSVSRAFLKELEGIESQQHDQLLQLVGHVFLEFKEDLENVYKVYCANYEKAVLLLESYKRQGMDQEILRILQLTASHFSAQNLSFFLVMPVQRIMRYPLLLRHILEAVPSNDIAYSSLQRALVTMEELNFNINEYKRCKEVATKYTKVEELSLMERLSRINKHTFSKKTTRLSQRLKQEAGLVPRMENKEFDVLVEKFQDLASQVTHFKENLATYLKNLEVFLSVYPHTCELDITSGSVQQYRCFVESLHQIIFPEFRRRLEQLVFQPLCSLEKCLMGPQQLIKKRLVKLLDYEQLQEKKRELGSITYEDEAAMSTYKAMDSMLLAELPSVNETAQKWMGQILRAFVALQRDLAKQVLQVAGEQLSKLPHSQVPVSAFWKLTEETLYQSGLQLSEFCKKFEQVLPSPSVQTLSPTTKLQITSLVKKYGPDKVYQVASNISGSKDMDLTLQKGQVVALLHDKDTKGNQNRWLVDTGGSRGYVPQGKLQPYHLVHDQTPMQQTLAPDNGMGNRRHSYTMQESPTPEEHSTGPLFHTVAAYAFSARSNQEVSLQPGQPLRVLEAQDKMGSRQWSLVEVNGQRGYVPSSFLMVVPLQDPSAWAGPGWPFPLQQT